MIRTGARTLAAILLSSWLSTMAFATDFPTQRITMITPFPAGGPNDTLARLLANHMSDTLGEDVVVENRAGASTTIGALQAMRAEPDGYTIFLATNTTLVTNRYLFKNLSYDPDAFAPIGMIGTSPLVLLSTLQDNFRSVDDIIAAALARPGSLSIASFGTGTSSHLAAEYFQRRANIQLLHVPFKGSNHALPQLVSGSIDLFFDMVATGMPLADAGKVNVHAITSAHRMPSMPDLPTMAESGFPGFEMTAWFTLVAPPGTSIDITGKLALALDTAVRDEAMRQHMLHMGIEPAEGTPRALTRQIERELPIIQSLVELADITVQ